MADTGCRCVCLVAQPMDVNGRPMTILCRSVRSRMITTFCVTWCWLTRWHAMCSHLDRQLYLTQRPWLSHISTVAASSRLHCITVEKRDLSCHGTAESTKAFCKMTIYMQKNPPNWLVHRTIIAIQSSSLILVIMQGKWHCFLSKGRS